MARELYEIDRHLRIETPTIGDKIAPLDGEEDPETPIGGAWSIPRPFGPFSWGFRGFHS